MIYPGVASSGDINNPLYSAAVCGGSPWIRQLEPRKPRKKTALRALQMLYEKEYWNEHKT
jgi:hypothetical protein